MLHKTPLKQDNFSGGFVSLGSELALQIGQSPDCLNVYSDLYKSLQKRLGYTRLSTASTSATMSGMYEYVRDDTTSYLLSMWATALKKMDSLDGTWDAVSADANKGTAFGASATEYAYFTSYGTDCFITTDNRDVPQWYDPTDDADHVDIDWKNSHCYIVGDTASVSTGASAYLKITIDATEFDDIDVTSLTTIAGVVSAINAHSGLSAKGWAYADDDGYLRVISNTRGSGGSIAVEDGTSDGEEATEALFDGTSQTGTTITSNIAPSGKYIFNWEDYLWIANTSANPDRIYYSNASDPFTWTATDFQDIITAGDVGLTGMGKIRDNMYVFKKWSTHRVTYLGGKPLFSFKEIKSNIGTSSPRTIVNCEIPNEPGGEVIIFLGSDQMLYKLNGAGATPIGEPISSYNNISTYCLRGDGSTYGINPDQLNECWAVNYPERHWYMLFFPKDDDTVCNDAFIFDYYTNSFWPFRYTDTFPAGCLADNGSGKKKVYVGGTNYTWLLDSGNTDRKGSDNSAQDINAYWTSPKMDFQSEVTAKDLRRMQLTTRSVACTPTYQHRADWESSYSTAETLTTATNVHVYDIPKMQELFQWKITDDSSDAAFEVFRASIVRGQRGQAI